MSALAEGQHLIVLTLDAPRGQIYSEDKGLYATNKPVYSLFINPQLIKEKEKIASDLARYMAVDSKEILSKINQNLSWVTLGTNIEVETKKNIENLKIDGLDFEENSTRFYPEASSAAHILGFVGSDEARRQKGYFGIEGYYNRQLKGVKGEITQERDAGGLPILMGTFLKQDLQKGYDLTLNIDRSVQYIVEKKLKVGLEKYEAKSASAVVMNPLTGDILAMAAYPNYDPNNYAIYSKSSFKNPIVADSYEPGSTFKTLIMAAAIEENKVELSTKCDQCAGPVEIDDFTIRTYDNKYRPNETMQDVLTHSDNTGMVFVGRKLGSDKLYDYLQKFGFGKITQVDLEGEMSPELRQKKDWREIDFATVTFGQGIAVTPIQIIRAVASLANGGYLLEPHIIKTISSGNKNIEIKPKIVSQPIFSKTAQTVKDMMVRAVDDGEAGKYTLKDYKIAGKTGTAQIPISGHYDSTKTVASFIGFAPADNPKFIMLILYVEPKTSIYGTATAAPTFFEIAKELFSYYQIPPDR